MASGERSGGLMSSAGLIRYFDEEDQRAIRFDPVTVMVATFAFGMFIQVLNFVYI